MFGHNLYDNQTKRKKHNNSIGGSICILDTRNIINTDTSLLNKYNAGNGTNRVKKYTNQDYRDF